MPCMSRKPWSIGRAMVGTTLGVDACHKKKEGRMDVVMVVWDYIPRDETQWDHHITDKSIA